MAKLRSDLKGVVYIDGTAYKAGDTVPAGAAVSSALTEPESARTTTRPRKTEAEPQAPARKRGRPRKGG